MAEFTEDRYGSWMGAIYIVFAICFFVINTGSMLKGAGKVISQATGGGVGVERDRRRDDGDVHPLQLRRRAGRRGVDGSLPGRPDHRALVHADSARLDQVVGGLDGMQRVARAVPFLAGDAGRHRAVGDRDADGQRPGRHHGAAASARGRRHRPRRADVPRRDALRQHGEARLHGRLGARRADRRGDDRAGARGRRDARRSGERVRLRLPAAARSRARSA